MHHLSGSGVLLSTLGCALGLAILATPVDAQSVATVESGRVPLKSYLGLSLEDPLNGGRATIQTTGQPKSRDAVWNGLLIGAGVGALLGLIPDYYDDCEECHDSLYWSIAVGAGVGLLIDFLRTGKSKPSPAHSEKRFQMNLAARPTAIGVYGTLRWPTR